VLDSAEKSTQNAYFSSHFVILLSFSKAENQEFCNIFLQKIRILRTLNTHFANFHSPFSRRLARLKWLQDFAYQTPISWVAFLITFLSTMAITTATISVHAIRAGLSNPVKSLKAE
jgi:hypothetical protein